MIVTLPHISLTIHCCQATPSFILNLPCHMISGHAQISPLCLKTPKPAQFSERDEERDGESRQVFHQAGRGVNLQKGEGVSRIIISGRILSRTISGAALEDASVNPRGRQPAQSLSSVFPEFPLFSFLHHSLQQQLLVRGDQESGQTFLQR